MGRRNVCQGATILAVPAGGATAVARLGKRRVTVAQRKGPTLGLWPAGLQREMTAPHAGLRRQGQSGDAGSH